MNAALLSLEEKVARVAARCRELHAENLALRSQLAGLNDEQAALRERLEAASARIERLVERLPEV